MNTAVSKFLTELYTIDPDLKKHEAELIPLIELLLKSNPTSEPDEQFVKELRLSLKERAEMLKMDREPERLSPSFLSSFFTMPKLTYAFAGAAAALVIAVPSVYYFTRSPDLIKTEDRGEPLFAYSVTPAADRAFGELKQLTPGSGVAEGRGGGGGGDARLQSGGGNAAEADRMSLGSPLVPPEILRFEYSYEGEIPLATGSTVPVFKRERQPINLSLSSVASGLNFGAVDINSFGPMKVESMSFYQDTPFGYMMYVQLRDGMVSLNQNWEQWPHPESKCRTEECFKQYRPTMSDVPTDEALIAIADAFAKDHSIDLSRYGKPQIDYMWKAYANRAPDQKEGPYVPDQLRVIYPLLLDGEPVHEENGIPSGISISVLVKQKRVFDVWGLRNNVFSKSNYDAVTNTEDIKKYISTIDNFPMPIDTMPTGQKVKTRTVKLTLEKPTFANIVYFQYNEDQAKELVVPALLFPVKNDPKEEYGYRQIIAVPLAKDLLEDALKRASNVYPLMERQ